MIYDNDNENNDNHNDNSYIEEEENNSVSTSISDINNENQNENLIMNNNEINNNINNEQTQNIKRNKYCYPPKLKKTFYFVIFLTIIGILLLIFSIIEIFNNFNLTSFLCKIVLSIFVLIPGLYYLYLFIKAYNEKDEDNKNDIYNEIPSIGDMC